MGTHGCVWVYCCTISQKRGTFGTGGRRHVWFGGATGREISRHIMFGLILPKNRQNEKQVHKTWTNRHINYAYNLTKAIRNQQSPKTHPNEKNILIQKKCVEKVIPFQSWKIVLQNLYVCQPYTTDMACGCGVLGPHALTIWAPNSSYWMSLDQNCPDTKNA